MNISQRARLEEDSSESNASCLLLFHNVRCDQ